MKRKELYIKLKEKIGPLFPTVAISTINIKNQKGEYLGIKFESKEEEISLVYNLDALAKMIKTKSDFEGVLKDIIQELKSNSILKKADLSILKDFQKLKSHLCLDVIPIQGNEEYLKDIPYKVLDDQLVTIMKAYLSNPYKDIGFIPIVTIDKNIMDELNVPFNQLYENALRNSPFINPPQVMEVSDFLFGDNYVENESLKYHDNAKYPVKILTTITGICGTSAMLSSFGKEQMAKNLKGNYYLIPCSKFCVTFPTSFPMAKEFIKLINEALKETSNPPIGEIQHYDSKRHILELKVKYEKRMKEKALNSINQELSKSDISKEIKREEQKYEER